MQPADQRIQLNVCARCHTPDRYMEHCARCRCAFYCDRVCQSRHWKDPSRPHKAQCVPFEDTPKEERTVAVLDVRYAQLPRELEGEPGALDMALIDLIQDQRWLTESYRFLAHGLIAGQWLVGDLRTADKSILCAKAVKVGAWVLAIEHNLKGRHSNDYCITGFLGDRHAHFLAVDALPDDVPPAQALLDWVVHAAGPFVQLSDEQRAEADATKWVARKLRDPIMYEFLAPPKTEAVQEGK